MLKYIVFICLLIENSIFKILVYDVKLNVGTHLYTLIIINILCINLFDS